MVSANKCYTVAHWEGRGRATWNVHKVIIIKYHSYALVNNITSNSTYNKQDTSLSSLMQQQQRQQMTTPAATATTTTICHCVFGLLRHLIYRLRSQPAFSNSSPHSHWLSLAHVFASAYYTVRQILTPCTNKCICIYLTTTICCTV